jgi:hypothetical protein
VQIRKKMDEQALKPTADRKNFPSWTTLLAGLREQLEANGKARRFALYQEREGYK